MKKLFIDSFFLIALLSERDAAHDQADKFAKANRAALITTRWILMELADALSGTRWRRSAGDFIEFAVSAGKIIIVDDHQLFVRGLGLYRQRPDKDWSLTDCISFLVMADQGVTEALTNDHHFEQAGFVALFR